MHPQKKRRKRRKNKCTALYAEGRYLSFLQPRPQKSHLEIDRYPRDCERRNRKKRRRLSPHLWKRKCFYLDGASRYCTSAADADAADAKSAYATAYGTCRVPFLFLSHCVALLYSAVRQRGFYNHHFPTSLATTRVFSSFPLSALSCVRREESDYSRIHFFSFPIFRLLIKLLALALRAGIREKAFIFCFEHAVNDRKAKVEYFQLGLLSHLLLLSGKVGLLF